MNAMLDRLQTGQLAQQRFVGDSSHELRSRWGWPPSRRVWNWHGTTRSYWTGT